MTFGRRLRDYIELNGLTIRQFEQLTGIPYRSLQEYLADKRKPNAEHMAVIAENGLDIDWLLTGKKRPAVLFDFSEYEKLEPITGILAADRELLGYFSGDAVEIVDEAHRKHLAKGGAPFGLMVLLTGVWSALMIYATAADRHAEVLRAAKSNAEKQKAAAMLIDLLHDKIVEKLRYLTDGDESARAQPSAKKKRRAN